MWHLFWVSSAKWRLLGRRVWHFQRHFHDISLLYNKLTILTLCRKLVFYMVYKLPGRQTWLTSLLVRNLIWQAGILPLSRFTFVQHGSVWTEIIQQGEAGWYSPIIMYHRSNTECQGPHCKHTRYTWYSYTEHNISHYSHSKMNGKFYCKY